MKDSGTVWYGPFCLFIALFNTMMHGEWYTVVPLFVLGALFTVFEAITDPI